MQKVDDLFFTLIVALKTQVFTVTSNAQNTLQHFQGKCPQNVSIFFRRGRLCLSKGDACAMAQWHDGQSNSDNGRRLFPIISRQDMRRLAYMHVTPLDYKNFAAAGTICRLIYDRPSTSNDN